MYMYIYMCIHMYMCIYTPVYPLFIYMHIYAYKIFRIMEQLMLSSSHSYNITRKCFKKQRSLLPSFLPC